MTSVESREYNKLLKEYGEDHVGEGNAKDPMWHWMRWKCITDLYWLGTEILGLAKMKGRAYPKLHRWLCGVMSTDDDKMILIPRKHAKTTWVCAWMAQLIIQAAGKIRILYLSRTEKLVSKNLASVKRFLRNPLLIRLFPEVIPEPGKDYKNWKKSTQNELLMREDDEMVSSEPQIVAYGSAAAFTGSSIDVIIMDDYIDDKTVRSPALMEQSVEDWQYLQPLLDFGGHVCIIGTFYHYNDLYNVIIREKHFDKKHIFIRQVVENGHYIYPTMFNDRRMERIRRIESPYIVSCQYFLNPTPKEDQVFPAPQPICSQLPKDKYRYFIMVDPAPTTTRTSDSTGFVVAAVNHLKNIFYVEAFAVKKDGEGKADILVRLCAKYHPERVGIEYGLQQDLSYIIKAKRTEYENANHVRLSMNIYPIKINNQRSKGDRIHHTLGQFVRNGKVMIVESGCFELLRQMDTFTGKGKEHDDVVDAASMLFPLAEEFGVSANLMDRMKPTEGTFFDVFRKRSKGSWRSNFVA
jgi:hypothetical protein